jgi:streptomycin 6-kinase
VRDLPAPFLAHNDDPAWLAALPGRLAELGQRWQVAIGPHFPNLSYNYVAPATRADGQRCVVKLSRHIGDTANEIAALRVWAGRGAAQLLEADQAIGALLVERLEPGTMLSEVAWLDDDRATTIAAEMLRQLWRPAPAVRDSSVATPCASATGALPASADAPGGALRSLASYTAAYDRNRAALSAGKDSFPAALFQCADALRAELLDSTVRPVVLHGDLHHFNVLRAGRAEWLAIDPHGLAGDRCFDVCQFLRNPIRVSPAANRRRLDIFCAALGLDRPRVNDWCFVHAMLNACWSFEDGEPWAPSVAYAEETLTF